MSKKEHNNDFIILGINDGHDASAAIMVNGELIAAAQEERWTRLKADYGYPKNSISYCLKEAAVDTKDINIVALSSLGWNPVLTYLKRNANFDVDDWIREQNDFWVYELGLKDFNCKPSYYQVFKDVAKKKGWQLDNFYPIQGLIEEYIKEGDKVKLPVIRRKAISEQLNINESKILEMVHEDCHRYYAYYGSRIEKPAIVLTAEGCGDYSNHTVSFRLGDNKIYHTKENHIAHIYQYITLLLGMKPAQHEYKVMGLAPYANIREVEKSYRVFKDILKVDDLKIVYDKKP